MDTIKDLFNDVKSRLSNPLLFSLLCSWIIWNWRIVLSITFFRLETVKTYNLIEFSNFLQSQSSLLRGIILPVSSAITYVLAFPQIKKWIKLYNAKVDRDLDLKLNQITETITLPFSEFLEEEKRVRNQQEQIKNLLINKSNHLNKISELQSEIELANTTNKQNIIDISTSNNNKIKDLLSKIESHRSEFSELEKKHTNLLYKANSLESNYNEVIGKLDNNKKFNSLEVLNGDWSVQIDTDFSDDEMTKIETWHISHGRLTRYIANKRAGSAEFKIDDLISNSESRKMVFTLEPVQSGLKNKKDFFLMNILSENSQLEGLINGEVSVTMSQIIKLQHNLLD